MCCRQIVGFSLPSLAVKVKIKAARCNVSLKELFVEMWTLYKNNSKKERLARKDWQWRLTFENLEQCHRRRRRTNFSIRFCSFDDFN